MLQMLAPTSDIMFLKRSPQAPVEIANSVMMQPIARTHRRRTTMAFDASHAFANERSAAYDVACANQAWDRVSAFLKANIA